MDHIQLTELLGCTLSARGSTSVQQDGNLSLRRSARERNLGQVCPEWICDSTYFPASDSEEESQHVRLLPLLQFFDVLEGAHFRCKGFESAACKTKAQEWREWGTGMGMGTNQLCIGVLAAAIGMGLLDGWRVEISRGFRFSKELHNVNVCALNEKPQSKRGLACNPSRACT